MHFKGDFCFFKIKYGRLDLCFKVTLAVSKHVYNIKKTTTFMFYYANVDGRGLKHTHRQ